ncbi:hypothetical protein CRG98_017600 [Punica granatum]|uniref:Uncharacterized protein n=1 Tax=Punica granatum TaxID=22663 RepID=A0A2I0K0C3_PUNGR|nr:hypothetical protein CRG98_017600 [Punica granatum]
MGRANETCTRTGCPLSFMALGVSYSLKPRVSVNHGITVMPLDSKTCDVRAQIEDRATRRSLRKTRVSRLEPPQIGPGLGSWPASIR